MCVHGTRADQDTRAGGQSSGHVPEPTAQCSLKRGRTQAANRHVLDSKNLLTPPSQYPVARFSVQVVCNKVLHGSHFQNSYHKKRLAAVQTVSAREHVFILQNCASECVNNRTYRTLQETCDEGAPCSLGQGSEALIGSLHIQALPTNHQKTRTCCCTCSCYKILCCNMPSDKNFLRKRACVRPRFKEHCAGLGAGEQDDGRPPFCPAPAADLGRRCAPARHPCSAPWRPVVRSAWG